MNITSAGMYFNYCYSFMDIPYYYFQIEISCFMHMRFASHSIMTHAEFRKFLAKIQVLAAIIAQK